MRSKNMDLFEYIENGDIDGVRRLIDLVDHKANDYLAFYFSAKTNQLEMVKLLLPPTKLATNQSKALIVASAYGHIDIVRFLIKYADPCFDNSEALKEAVRQKNLDIVKLLIDLSNPKDNDSECIKIAASLGDIDLIDVLFDVSDVDLVINAFKNNNADYVLNGNEVYNYLKIRHDAKTIRDAIETSSDIRPNRKKKII